VRGRVRYPNRNTVEKFWNAPHSRSPISLGRCCNAFLFLLLVSTQSNNASSHNPRATSTREKLSFLQGAQECSQREDRGARTVTMLASDSSPTQLSLVSFGSRDKVFGDVLGCGSQGVAARHPHCILSILGFVGLAANGKDPMQCCFLSPC
jgi:hypothetical protein